MNYRNLDLSELSCYAAGEIDDYILDRSEGFDATNELASRMKRFSKEKLTQIDLREELNYYRVFEGDKSIKTTNDLQDRILQIVQELDSVKKLSKKRLESLRAICLVISYKAVNYNDYYPKFLVV